MAFGAAAPGCSVSREPDLAPPEPQELRATIGAAGGEIDGWGVTVEVAPGAVGASAVFTAKPAMGPCRGALGKAFELGPARKFDGPVRVAIEPPREALPLVAPAELRLATSSDCESWELLPSSTSGARSARSVSGLASHFSFFAIVPGASQQQEYLYDETGHTFSLAGLNLSSSEEVNVHSMLVSPTWVDYVLTGTGAPSTVLTLTGLQPSTTLYFYDGSHRAAQAVSVDATGKATYTQTLGLERHAVFVLTHRSTCLALLPDRSIVVTGDSSPGPLSLGPGEGASVGLTYAAPIIPAPMRALKLRPRLRLDDRLPGNVVERYAITVRLPPGVPGLTATTHPPVSVTTEDGQAVIRWLFTQRGLTGLVIKWSESGIRFSVEKTATEIRTTHDQPVDVLVTVRNDSSEPVSGVTLVETFGAETATPLGPLDEFVAVGDWNGRGHEWRKELGALAPGAEISFGYQLRLATVFVALLGVVAALVGGSPVAYSNRPVVKSAICGNRICDEPETTASCAYDCPNPDDADNDGISDTADNCPVNWNPNQANLVRFHGALNVGRLLLSNNSELTIAEAGLAEANVRWCY